MGYDWRCADCNAYVDSNETHCPYCAKEDQVKLGDINKAGCTCGGHSEYCVVKDAAKPQLLIMDGDFFMELKNAINANGADKMHLAIDIIAEGS